MVPLRTQYYDYSMYEGRWQSDEENLYDNTYLQFDADGNWQLYSDNEVIDEGYLRYDAEEDVTYVRGYRNSTVADGFIKMEGDRLNISTCGYFNYLDGRGGQWHADGGGD